MANYLAVPRVVSCFPTHGTRSPSIGIVSGLFFIFLSYGILMSVLFLDIIYLDGIRRQSIRFDCNSKSIAKILFF